MTTSLDDPRSGEQDSGHRDTSSFWTGRSELFVALFVAAIGVFLLTRTVAMDVPSSVSFLGPRFFPAVVGSLLVVLGSLLAVRVLRSPRRTPAPVEHDAESETETAGSDWKPLLITAATLASHLLLLETAGWIIAGALLFWGVSYALGGRHVLRDLGASFVISSVVQLAFSAGLGLSLPSGILVGVV